MADKDDKPGHIISIPDSLGRDVDRAKAGTLKSVLPVEAFMSDAALAQVEAQTRAAATPIHAEQLTPISHAEARRRRTFGGESLPDFPQTRRVIPPPFQRPRISAGRHGKTWQFLPANLVLEGDLITGVGLVVKVQEETVYATVAEILGVGHEEFTAPDTKLQDPDEKVAVGIVVVVTGKGGEVRAYRETDQVKVFRNHGQEQQA